MDNGKFFEETMCAYSLIIVDIFFILEIFH